MLNVSDNRGATKSFTFTLFLDDVISSSDDSFVEFLETSSEKVDNHCISFKNEDWELATQAVSPKINSLESPEKTVTFGRKLSLRIESPTFNDNSNCKQNERKKKKLFFQFVIWNQKMMTNQVWNVILLLFLFLLNHFILMLTKDNLYFLTKTICIF